MVSFTGVIPCLLKSGIRQRAGPGLSLVCWFTGGFCAQLLKLHRVLFFFKFIIGKIEIKDRKQVELYINCDKIKSNKNT